MLEQVIRDTEQIAMEDYEESMPIEGTVRTIAALSMESLLLGAALVMAEPEEAGKATPEQAGQLEELLTRLPTVMNRKFVDEVSGCLADVL